MTHRIVRGEILYSSKKPEMMDKERGRETFVFTHHVDGRTTVQAHCEIDEPEPKVMRDVIYSMHADRRPADAFVRLTVGGEFMGAGIFIIGEDAIECESYGPSIGRVSQKIPTNGHYDWFGTHPLAVDGFNTRMFDRSEGPIKRRMRSFLSSLDHRGATPPMVAGHHIFLEYIGIETVTVKAGTFSARHFAFVGEDGDPLRHPPYDLWVTDDEDSIFLRGSVGGYMKTYYELVKLER